MSFRLAEDATGAGAMLVDAETGSRWQAFTGRAVDGPLAGRTLERAASHLSFWFAWKDWYPETDLYAGQPGLPRS